MRVSKYMPELICSLPWDLQKLLWLAFHYQHRIRQHEKCFWWLGDDGNAEKLDRYLAAYERIKRLIVKLCERKGFEEICLVEDGRRGMEEKIFEE